MLRTGTPNPRLAEAEKHMNLRIRTDRLGLEFHESSKVSVARQFLHDFDFAVALKQRSECSPEVCQPMCLVMPTLSSAGDALNLYMFSLPDKSF
jgi:hypothetical protein